MEGPDERTKERAQSWASEARNEKTLRPKTEEGLFPVSFNPDDTPQNVLLGNRAVALRTIIAPEKDDIFGFPRHAMNNKSLTLGMNEGRYIADAESITRATNHGNDVAILDERRHAPAVGPETGWNAFIQDSLEKISEYPTRQGPMFLLKSGSGQLNLSPLQRAFPSSRALPQVPQHLSQ